MWIRRMPVWIAMVLIVGMMDVMLNPESMMQQQPVLSSGTWSLAGIVLLLVLVLVLVLVLLLVLLLVLCAVFCLPS